MPDVLSPRKLVFRPDLSDINWTVIETNRVNLNPSPALVYMKRSYLPFDSYNTN